MEQLTPAANGIINTAMAGSTLSENSAARRPRRSDSCAACGAWRGQLGLEPTPDLYVEHLVEVFREVWRVLRVDGTIWLNLGDRYVGSGRGPTRPQRDRRSGASAGIRGRAEAAQPDAGR
jgi:hypothetical protein